MPESEAKKAKPGEMSQRFGSKSKSSPAHKSVLLEEQLNLEHPLVKLSEAIGWREIEAEFGVQTSREGG